MTSSQLSECLQKKDLNPKTCTFQAKCKKGYVRDPEFNCVNGKSIEDQIKELENRILKMHANKEVYSVLLGNRKRTVAFLGHINPLLVLGIAQLSGIRHRTSGGDRHTLPDLD